MTFRYEYSRVILIAAALVINGVFITVSSVPVEVGAADPPPPDDDINGTQYIDGDWTIAQDDDVSLSNETVIMNGSVWVDNYATLRLYNCTFIMNGNITVDADATLILRNTTIMMNCTESNGEYYFYVDDRATLIMSDWDYDPQTTHDRSIITDSPDDDDNLTADGVNDFRYKFWVGTSNIGQISHVKINNSIIRECGWDGSKEESGLYVRGVDDFIMEDCLIENSDTGIYLTYSNVFSIRNNTFAYCSATGMSIYTHSNFGVIADNTILNCTTTGLHCFASDSRIFNNTIYNCSLGFVYSGNSNEAYNNTISHATKGLLMAGPGQSFHDNYIHNITQSDDYNEGVYFNNPSNAIVWNNVFENISSPEDFYAIKIHGSSDLHFHNNTIKNCSGNYNSYTIYMQYNTDLDF